MTATTPRWLDEREQATWRAFLEMTSRLHARLGREMQDHHGLSQPDFAVLVQLSEHEGDRMRVLELARALRWEKSRLSHQLRRMEQRGLLERSSCSEDRRGAWVGLTRAGRTAVERAAPTHVETVRENFFDQLRPDQLEALATILDAVLARLDANGEADRDDGPEDACPDTSC